MTYPLHSGTKMKGFCMGFLSIAVINTIIKSNMRRKGFMTSYSLYYSPSLREVREGTQRSLKAGTGANTTKEHCLLACFHGFPSLLSYAIHDHQPKDGSISVSCTLPH